VAKRVVLVDDLDGSEGAETVKFGLDGKQYEIDLSTDHAASLRNLLATYIARAREVEEEDEAPRPLFSRPVPVPSQPRQGYAPIDRDQAAVIRSWARDNGHDVSDRGRIPARVVELYNSSR
jgi:hypothetical protein